MDRYKLLKWYPGLPKDWGRDTIVCEDNVNGVYRKQGYETHHWKR